MPRPTAARRAAAALGALALLPALPACGPGDTPTTIDADRVAAPPPASADPATAPPGEGGARRGDIVSPKDGLLPD